MPSSSQPLRVIFEQALLAQAAYASLTGIDFADQSLLRNKLVALRENGRPTFTPRAAAYFAANFGVVHHQPNTSTGYSATLFRRRTVSPGDDTGGFVFAIRGTELTSDAWSDDLWRTDIQQIFAGGQRRGLGERRRVDYRQSLGKLRNQESETCSLAAGMTHRQDPAIGRS